MCLNLPIRNRVYLDCVKPYVCIRVGPDIRQCRIIRPDIRLSGKKKPDIRQYLARHTGRKKTDPAHPFAPILQLKCAEIMVGLFGSFEDARWAVMKQGVGA